MLPTGDTASQIPSKVSPKYSYGVLLALNFHHICSTGLQKNPLLQFHLAKQFFADDYCCSVENWWELSTITCCSFACHSPSCCLASSSKTATLSFQGTQTTLLSIAGVGRWLPQISNFKCSTKDIWDTVGKDFNETILLVST